jgi:hypothetical protein
MSTTAFAIGWIAWVVFGVVWEILGIASGRGALTGFWHLLEQNDIARSVISAFFAWWVYHWWIEPWALPQLRGLGPDDAGVGLLAGLLAFFGRRKR